MMQSAFEKAITKAISANPVILAEAEKFCSGLDSKAINHLCQHSRKNLSIIDKVGIFKG